MFPLKYLIGLGGVAVAETGTGVGIYYGTRDNRQPKSQNPSPDVEFPQSALQTQVTAPKTPAASASAASTGTAGAARKK